MYHEAYLLLAAGGIEGHGNGPDAKGAEVGVEILHGILREYPDVLLHLHSQVEQGVRHLFHYCRKIVPCHRPPVQASEVTEGECGLGAVFLGLLVDKHRKMTICLHSLQFNSANIVKAEDKAKQKTKFFCFLC